MKKKKTAPARAGNKIPIARVYREDGIFEDRDGRFTEMYRLEHLQVQQAEVFHHNINRLYEKMPLDCVFQLVVHNALIPKEDYLRTVLVPQDTCEAAKVYNRLIMETADVGYNNIKKTVYLVIGKKAGSIEKAREYFASIREQVEAAFQSIPIVRLDALERLKVMYQIFNANKNSFGAEIDLKNDGTLNLDNLKYMHMTERDLIASQKWSTGEQFLFHTILDEGLPTESYSRSLFLNGVPKEISSNVISDLTSISNNMLFSVTYHPVDTKLGFEEASKLVRDNTTIIRKAKRDTLRDKKNKTMELFTERKTVSELVYFHEAALERMKAAVAAAEPVMEVCVTITLFADTQDELERNTEMLRVSASKFACSVKTLDMVQKEGFISSLPLCRKEVDVSRFFDGKKLTGLSPVLAAATVQRGGIFHGLNAINDNQVFVNRKAGSNLSGVITGMERSGKTYQMKREILGALVTTRDRINVIAFKEEYDSFIESLHGRRAYVANRNPFSMTPGYGVTGEDREAKGYFLTALNRNAEETQRLLESSVELNALNEVETVFQTGEYQSTEKALSKVSVDIYREQEKEDCRISLYRVSAKEELLVTLEYLWNWAIEDKKNNLTDWLFVDGIDCLLREDSALSYLLRYNMLSSGLKNMVTYVVQDAVGLMGSIAGKVALEKFLLESGYVKLLNAGPVERKALAEMLNISNSLMPYITNVEHGQGLIITQSGTVPFDDNYLEKEHEFMRMHSE